MRLGKGGVEGPFPSTWGPGGGTLLPAPLGKGRKVLELPGWASTEGQH